MFMWRHYEGMAEQCLQMFQYDIYNQVSKYDSLTHLVENFMKKCNRFVVFFLCLDFVMKHHVSRLDKTLY